MIAWLISLGAGITQKMVLIGSAVALALCLYLYVQHLRSTVTDLEQKNATLQVAVQEQQKTIDTIKKNYDQIIKAKDDLAKKKQQLEEANKKLKALLYPEQSGKESLEDLILKDKKGEMQALINGFAARELRCLEILTGSPLKKGEIIVCD